MEAASHYSSVHGVLLTMRNCVDATNWRRILKDAATLAGGEGSEGSFGHGETAQPGLSFDQIAQCVHEAAVLHQLRGNVV